MLFLIIFNPILSFVLNGFFGRFLGHLGTRFFSTLLLFSNFIFVLYCFFKMSITSENYTLNLGTWISSGLFSVEWSFIIDDLTIIMLIVVNFISFLVHLYSTKYMDNDPHIARFMSYLSLFTFFMLLLITADNYIQLFLGWEGVGLCSFLLISFWYTRIQANKSALKAIIVNRISDFALTLGIILIFYYILSVDFNVSFAISKFLINYTILTKWIFLNIYILTLIAFLLYLGAVGKSAQILLHTWLPDAMEGPTPVSALIHAATMVTAGVFLLIKCSSIFEYSSTTLLIIAFSGAITSLFAATSGLMLSDIKKVIAYSTCSQLGYMIFACGFSAYNVSLFHLMNHAIFKALLFLCAGAVIHSVSNEQDMRRMGGLVNLLPLSYSSILVASLAITGFPYLTGFFSKDIILETSAGIYGTSGFFVHWLASLTAFFTAFYSFRLLYLVFLAPTNILRHYALNIHESPIQMGLPLILLSFGSIFIGYLFKDLMIGIGNTFLTLNIVLYPKFLNLNDSEFLTIIIKLIPLIMSFLGLITFIYLLIYWRKNIFFYKKFWNKIFNFLFSKWQFDRIYNIYINNFILKIAKQWTYKLIDKGLLEILGPFGFWKILKFIGFNLLKLSNGLLSNYLFFMAFFVLFFSYLLTIEFFSFFSFFSFFFLQNIAWQKKKWNIFKYQQYQKFKKELNFTFARYKFFLLIFYTEEWKWYHLLLNDDESWLSEEFHPLYYWTEYTAFYELYIKAFRHYLKHNWPFLFWTLYVLICFCGSFIFSLCVFLFWTLYFKVFITLLSYNLTMDLYKIFHIIPTKIWWIHMIFFLIFSCIFWYFISFWYYVIEKIATYGFTIKNRFKARIYFEYINPFSIKLTFFLNIFFSICFLFWLLNWICFAYYFLCLDVALPYLFYSFADYEVHNLKVVNSNSDYFTFKTWPLFFQEWQKNSPFRFFYRY